MSLTVHLKLCIPVPIECLIAEWRYRLKDFRLIDSDGNSLMFHKTILQNISPKFDYLNKFCGEVGDGIEQMRLQTLGYYALQALYDLIYVGPLVTDEKRAWELCDQLQVLQLPLVTERRLESYINYKEVQLNNSYSDKEKNPYLPYTSTPNTSLTRRMILPTEDVELLNRHGSNVDEIQETSRTVRWFDLNEIQQRGTQIKRTTTDGLSCIKQASVQSKLKRKQDIALHRMTVTSMTSSLKSDGPSREVKELNKHKTDDKEKFLADFGLFCSPRPITRSLVKAIGMGSESLLPEKNKTLSPSKSPPKKSVPRSQSLNNRPPDLPPTALQEMRKVTPKYQNQSTSHRAKTDTLL
uniref:BTB domain-containing protein n=1 Tax=Tetranychus urticae TaxID=32264 RepID=T1KXR4_TETUR